MDIHAEHLRVLAEFTLQQRAKRAAMRERQTFSVGQSQPDAGISFSIGIQPVPQPLSEHRIIRAVQEIQEIMESCSPSECARLANCWRL